MLRESRVHVGERDREQGGHERRKTRDGWTEGEMRETQREREKIE